MLFLERITKENRAVSPEMHSPVEGRSRARELLLNRENRNLLNLGKAGTLCFAFCTFFFFKWLVFHLSLRIFASLLFMMLSSTTVLLDTWGPHLYHQLLTPDAAVVPHRILMLFNMGDLAGIVP